MLNWFTILISLFWFSAFKAQEAGDVIARDADLQALIKVWSKRLGKNFILDERVKGKVTLYLPKDLSDADAENVLDLLLHYKGFAAVPVGENMYKIVPLKEAKQGTIASVSEASKKSSRIVSKVRKLRYASADEISKVIQPLLGPDGFLSSIAAINAIMVIDSEQNIARLDSLIDDIDVPSADVELTIIPINHTDAKEIADRLKELFDLGGSEPSSLSRLAEGIRSRLGTPAVAPQMSESVGASPAASTSGFVRVGAKESNIKLVADERSNSLIVVADPLNTVKIRAVVAQLDSPVNRSGRRFYFYKCKFARAEDIATTLASLVGQAAGTQSLQPRSEDQGVRRDSLLLGGRQETGLRGSSRRLGESRLSTDRRSVTGAKLSDDLSITADPGTNSIVIYATRAEYEKVAALLKQLDVRKKQVLVEATILEVQMLDQVNTDIDFITSLSGKEAGSFAQRGLRDLASIIQNPLSLSGFTAAVAGVGTLKIADDIVIPSQAALISAAQASQIANVLSAPQILTLDNEEAEILVGQNVPFIVSQSTSSANLENRFNQIDRQDVGITLRIRPQIASQDLVNLKVFLEVSSVVPGTDSNTQGPTTNVRTLDSTISAKNGQMIVIGGLITDDVSGSSDGIPYLRDIPVLGQLFGGSTDRKEKRNLLLFITPKVLVDQFDLRDETVSRSRKLRASISEIPHSVSRDDVLLNPAMDDVLIFDNLINPNYGNRSNQKAGKKFNESVEHNGASFKSGTTSGFKDKIFLKLVSNCNINDLPFKVIDGNACLRGLPDFAGTLYRLGYILGGEMCIFEVVNQANISECYTLSGFEKANFGREPWTKIDPNHGE